LAEIIVAALLGTAVALFIYFHGKRPLLDVRRSQPEPNRFNERIEIQNLGQTVYTYRVRAGDNYLTFEKNGKTRVTLPPGTATGVIVDSAAEALRQEPLVIECLDWLPLRRPIKVYQQWLENIYATITASYVCGLNVRSSLEKTSCITKSADA
jgi:hypothetical protein